MTDRTSPAAYVSDPDFTLYDGEVLEFPVGKGWDEQAIITTIAEIEAL